MKYLPTIAGILLALLFLMASVPVLLHLPMPEPKFTPGSPEEVEIRACALRLTR